MKENLVKEKRGKKLSLDAFKKQEVSNLNVDSQAGGVSWTITLTSLLFIEGDNPPRKRENDCH